MYLCKNCGHPVQFHYIDTTKELQPCHYISQDIYNKAESFCKCDNLEIVLDEVS